MNKPILRKLNWKYFKAKLIKGFSERLAAPICHAYYQLKYKVPPNPEQILWIQIDDISGWYRGNRFDEITFHGQIKGGNWSKKTTPKHQYLANSDKYRTIVERFVEGKTWQETTLFRERYINKKILPGNATNLNELANYYSERYDAIFESIKENKGLLPPDKNKPNIAPMYICIGSKGEIFWTVDGNHRLYMAMVLGIEKIPVKVLKRHKKWQAFRDQTLQREIKPFEHPDLVQG